MNRFRPQQLSRKFLMKRRRLAGSSDSYNWQSRIEWIPVGYKLNKKTIAKQFKQLHYLACHAPAPIRKRWKFAYQQFMNRHFAEAGNASIRYLNKYTCHAWM
jgi:hypothetical protein